MKPGGSSYVCFAAEHCEAGTWRKLSAGCHRTRRVTGSWPSRAGCPGEGKGIHIVNLMCNTVCMEPGRVGCAGQRAPACCAGLACRPGGVVLPGFGHAHESIMNLSRSPVIGSTNVQPVLSIVQRRFSHRRKHLLICIGIFTADLRREHHAGPRAHGCRKFPGSWYDANTRGCQYMDMPRMHWRWTPVPH